MKRTNGVIFRLAAVILIAALGLLGYTLPTAGENPHLPALSSHPASVETPEEHHAALVNRAIADGNVPILVQLDVHLVLEEKLPDHAALTAQRERLRSIQEQVLQRLSAVPAPEAARGIKRFHLFPGFAMQASAVEIQKLLEDPKVVRIFEDTPVPPLLDDSVPLIGADGSGTFSGFTGDGHVIAILDTGVDKHHTFLSGKVISEACYSSTVEADGSTSLCPDGVAESTAPDSGLNCPGSISGCDHGTHVAGIAAGKGDTFSGVAREAELIAIQVFSEVSGTICTNHGLSSPCILSYNSDLLKALERVFDLRNTYDLASVNMSLGGGAYPSACDDNPLKTPIDNLRAADIATVVASGNNGFTDAISSPACISTAVSVGSTTKSDIVSAFSNSADLLDLLAPGDSIFSSILDNSFGYKSGTSMAAPHVAGAWAVLRQAQSDATVDTILDAFKSTGVLITDTRTGAGNRIKPRIRVDAAIEAVTTGTGPAPEEPPPPQQIKTGETIDGITGDQGSERYFFIEVPAGASDLVISTFEGTGDVDLYVRFGTPPTQSEYDCRPYLPGNEETCEFSTAPDGIWYIMLHGWDAYADVSLTASYACEPGQILQISGTVIDAYSLTACRTIRTSGDGFTVNSDAYAQFRAGERITLSPGFRVLPGGSFNARVDTALAP
ncbi:S8 family peptidase [Thioalkalivibrio thiocyanodenitrificans]|uniref:S8 family peptidase n=1 Tax=Thioalkalivibrio thiocyanodenitrificans TaxID=243063 RepID=UPI00037F6DCE|nr:S8 family serine peptidase [Thioalkalivibrio thiocyanodenitrificans]